MRIILKDDTPIFARPKGLPFAEARLVEEQVEEWLRNGTIEESDSEFTSPVVMVKKRDGSPRLCVDFRRINKLTRKGIALQYIDDVIITALNEENVVLNLKEVIDTSAEYGLELNLKKYLTKNNTKFCMGPKEELSVNNLKKILTANPVLSIYNQKLETEVHTDASSTFYEQENH
ncbi:uncharacterized protein LOC128264546 [Drosophila gunungcola]|uniref:uncharacterized protein LOC128264546 n=1 Tax=Drosophila gunungcola TaxID=103775 RepID=UPI0022E69D79|nr:uncharacterized protein LOC128264546 [Drosophila gunungcola]